MYTADTLSRAPTISTENDNSLEEEAEYLMEMCTAYLPASKKRLDQYCIAQTSDLTCSAIVNYCRHGWPKDKHNVPVAIKPYWDVRGELSVYNNPLIYGNRIVVPLTLRKETLQKLHQGHQGIQRCRLHARYSVWWPGLFQEINDLVQRCPVCVKTFTPKREPLLPTKLPGKE